MKMTTAPLRGREAFGESQRDSDSKPRVARNELPWENLVRTLQTPTGLWLRSPHHEATTPLGLRVSRAPLPRVARSSLPWAGGRNPFGIGDPCKEQSKLRALLTLRAVRSRLGSPNWAMA